MEKEYKLSVFWRALNGLAAFVLIGAGVYVYIILPLKLSSLCLFLVLFGTGLFIGIDIFKRRVITSDTAIQRINVLGKKQIQLVEIGSIRIEATSIIIVPKDKSRKNILIAYAHLSNHEEFINWLKGKFTSRDA